MKLESLNLFLNRRGRRSETRYARHRREVTQSVGNCLLLNKLWRRYETLDRAYLVIYSLRVGAIDPDNACVKPWLDALVSADIIPDDTEQCVEYEFEQYRAHPLDQRTVLFIYRAVPNERP